MEPLAVSNKPQRAEPEQEVQEREYAFPYHYLPSLDGGRFRQHAYWSWGFRYLGGLHVVSTLCGADSFDSLLDIGCGDGRFVSHLAAERPGVRLMGVDYSKRAISMAKGLNPGLDFRIADITTDDLGGQRFDVLTLVEVIEHIPPADLSRFVERAVSFLNPGGRLILTVPHRNKRVNEKHFQHFDSAMLNELLGQHLREIEFTPFDFPSRTLDLWFRFLGRTGRFYLITWPPLLNAFYRYYLRHHLLGDDESRCFRIAAVGRRPGE